MDGVEVVGALRLIRSRRGCEMIVFSLMIMQGPTHVYRSESEAI